MKLLLIDKNRELSQVLVEEFEGNNFFVDYSESGAEGLERVLRGNYDCIILDLMLPKVDGFQIIEKIREDGIDVPTIIITTKDSIEDRVEGFERGADDYLIKPFDFRELLARVKALIRRSSGKKHPLVRCGDLTLDPIARECRIEEQLIPLRKREFDILELLMRHENQVFTRERIISHVWQKEYDGTSNVVDVHIKYLRDKLRINNYDRIVVTVRGVGYKVSCPESY